MKFERQSPQLTLQVLVDLTPILVRTQPLVAGQHLARLLVWPVTTANASSHKVFFSAVQRPESTHFPTASLPVMMQSVSSGQVTESAEQVGHFVLLQVAPISLKECGLLSL